MNKGLHVVLGIFAPKLKFHREPLTKNKVSDSWNPIFLKVCKRLSPQWPNNVEMTFWILLILINQCFFLAKIGVFRQANIEHMLTQTPCLTMCIIIIWTKVYEKSYLSRPALSTSKGKIWRKKYNIFICLQQEIPCIMFYEDFILIQYLYYFKILTISNVVLKVILYTEDCKRLQKVK